MQKKSFLKLFTLTIIILGMKNTYAEKLQCPSYDAIKNNVSFSRALINPNDKSWNFWSWPFLFQGKEWNIWFITSLENPTNPLQDGWKAYVKAKVINQHPEPRKLDDLYNYCVYSLWSRDQVGVMAFSPGYYP